MKDCEYLRVGDNRVRHLRGRLVITVRAALGFVPKPVYRWDGMSHTLLAVVSVLVPFPLGMRAICVRSQEEGAE